MKIISYFREHARITLAVIKTPRKFFEEVKHEDETNSESFAYLLVSNTIFIAETLIGLLFSGAPPILLLVIFLFVSIAILYVFLAIVFSTIYSAVLHLAVFMVKGKGKFHQTFKVICYSASPINFAGLFIFVTLMAFFRGSLTGLSTVILLGLFISMLYMFYIVVVGISVTSDISGSRAFAALMIQILIFAIIPILTYAPAYSPTPYNTPVDASYPRDIPNYEKYLITVYAGSTPKIDGIVDEEDKWYEGERLPVNVGGVPEYYIITTKHDFEHIYVLMEWLGDSKWEDAMSLYFEQDEGKPDLNRFTGRVDNYYQYSGINGTNYLFDAHYDGGYSVSEEQNGKVRGGYKKGIWTLEWQIPLNSGDINDIYINKFPAYLAFSIVNLGNGTERGIFPPHADPYKPETWSNMVITDKKKQ